MCIKKLFLKEILHLKMNSLNYFNVSVGKWERINGDQLQPEFKYHFVGS